MTTRRVIFALAGSAIVSLLPLIASAGMTQFAPSAAAENQQAQCPVRNVDQVQPAFRGLLIAVSSRGELPIVPSRAASPVLQGVSGLPAEAEGVVNRFIKSQQSRARGTEYAEGRKIVTGDLNNDGSPDIAVLYTLEGAHGGGNDYNQYLAVFLSVNGKYVYKTQRRIGGRFERNMDLKSIENGKVLFDTMEYLPKDPSCCPSKKGSTQFTLAEGKLVEKKPQPSK